MDHKHFFFSFPMETGQLLALSWYTDFKQSQTICEFFLASLTQSFYKHKQKPMYPKHPMVEGVLVRQVLFGCNDAFKCH